MKKFFYGLVLQIFVFGIISLSIALLVGIDNFVIPWTIIERTNTVDYIVYGVISFALLLVTLSSTVKLSTYGLLLLVCLASALFFVFWYPLYKENISTLIQWVTPSVATGVLLIVFSFIVYRKLRYLKYEKQVDTLIKSTYKTYKNYSRLLDAKWDDKTSINLIDGVERKDEMHFYDIDFSIKEHDK